MRANISQVFAGSILYSCDLARSRHPGQRLAPPQPLIIYQTIRNFFCNSLYQCYNLRHLGETASFTGGPANLCYSDPVPPLTR